MPQVVPTPVTRRQAAVGAALSGAALVVLGYASGWGLALPVAGSVIAAETSPSLVAPSRVSLPSGPGPVRQPQHYSASGPTTTASPASSQPSAAPSSAPTSTPTSTPTVTPTVTPSPPKGSGQGSGGGRRTTCTGLRPALQALIEHVEAGHLQESLSQQVSDLLDLSQYADTHTTLLANLLAPLAGGATTDMDLLLQHVDAGHLEESPAQQAQDLIATDKYVRTHTVLIENLLKPLVGDSGCRARRRP